MPLHHFHYKHPLFGRGKNWRDEPHKIKQTEKGIRWDRSPYYAWFECLLRSEGYKKYCETGRGPYKQTYENFGDVFAYENNFKKWFKDDERGITLFAEPFSPIEIKLLNSKDEIEWHNSDLRVLQFDVNRHRTFALKKVRQIVNAACHQAQETRVLSKAKIQFHTAPKDIDAYLRMLKVWDLKQQGMKNAEIHKICYPQTGRDYRTRMKQRAERNRRQGLGEKVDRSQAVNLLNKQKWQEVDRDYKRARKLIENAAKGSFPNTK